MNKPMAIVLAAAVSAALVLAGCGRDEPIDPCKIHPTKRAADGTWIEWDDEPLDGDPCDADDLTETGHKKPGVKPVKPSPAKPAPARTTNRRTGGR